MHKNLEMSDALKQWDLIFVTASPALSSARVNSYGSGPIGTHQPSPTHLQYTMQQQQQQQQQVPHARPPASNGNAPFATVLASDLPQPASRSSPLAVEDGQRAQRFAEDYARLSTLIMECDPDAVRRAIRDNFEKSLLGSHYHTAFVMNVAMHRSDEDILLRAIRDFGSRIVSAGKHDLVGWMSQSDLDEVADQIISKASNTFLDKALVARLPTIEARRLVNALARAERLGYDANDIVDNERVVASVPVPKDIPSVKDRQPGPEQIPQEPAEQTVAQALAKMEPQPPESINPSVPRCQICHRGFPGPIAHNHHIKRNLCTRPAPLPGPGGEMYTCFFCGQTLSTIGGLQYHMMNKVCGDYGDIPKDRVVPTKPLASLNSPTRQLAPDIVPTHVSSFSNSPAAQHYSTAPAAMQTPRAAPPSTQPDSSESVPLGTPQAKDMAHLTATQVHALKEELRIAEENFKIKINDTQRAGGDPGEVQKRLTSLRNSYACKQSTIRKKYNIKLRQRRGREAMENERARMGIPSQVPRTLGTPTRDVHADKRARINGNGDATTTMATEASQQDMPIKTVPVTEMGNGLNGSNATAATQDPTLNVSQPARPRSMQGEPRQPSSSYQQNGYHVEVHVPSPSKKPNAAPEIGDTPSQAASGGSLTAKKLLQRMQGSPANDGDEDDSSSDDSSTDGEE
ncbi:hypothetical protein LZ32DRAFT_633489 [Colletotrichum eremochloae]|nr:hypothetical protein LZ32DRAFT_633489 [Colletotrichum eremochloae]